MKKHVHSRNRRRKKTVAQRKAAYARCIAAMHPSAMWDEEQLDERQFLMDALQPFHDTIVRALIPLYRDIFEGDDPANDPPEETVGYAVDLISDASTYDGFDDPIATAIHDIYRDGAEAGLRHVERAIEWYRAFDAQRRQAMVGGRSSEAAPKAST
jgi:hypothetical protein